MASYEVVRAVQLLAKDWMDSREFEKVKKKYKVRKGKYLNYKLSHNVEVGRAMNAFCRTLLLEGNEKDRELASLNLAMCLDFEKDHLDLKAFKKDYLVNDLYARYPKM